MNPFTPNFGQMPNYFAGRQELIAGWMSGFNNIPGDPVQTTLLIGPRGTGKTALLTYFSFEIQSKGWISVNVSCIDGMLDDIFSQALLKTNHLINNKKTSHEVTISASIPILGAEIAVKSKDKNIADGNWRINMTDIIHRLNEMGVGLLITIDEVNMSVKEMTVFAGQYQHFIREGLKVALLMAGLPHNVSLLLNSESNSFLRRANQNHIGNIPDYEIKDALKKIIKQADKTITDEALDKAVKAIGGYPFMFQLVGFRAWIEADDNSRIDVKAMMAGIEIAKQDFESRILKTSLDDVSDVGILFLKAMLEDENYSILEDIGKRLGKTKSYVTNYKNRLSEYGLIEDIGRGKYRYALPGMREYLKEYSV